MNKRTVKVRNITIGEGRPKICVPIVGKTQEEILQEAASFSSIPVDVVEWRIDWFDQVFDSSAVISVLEQLRKQLGETPVLVTFRTAGEGGEKAIEPDKYVQLYKEVMKSGNADLIDVELFLGDDLMKELVNAAHGAGVQVVASNHDFHKTPSQEEIVARLKKMQELGADIPKIAVMPVCPKDVLTLLSATEEMSSQHADRPIITMSMAKTGVISRLCGEAFGSALTFGAAKKASAPGQVAVSELDQILELLHSN